MSAQIIVAGKRNVGAITEVDRCDSDATRGCACRRLDLRTSSQMTFTMRLPFIH
jgi:hypothetical protein